MVGHQQEPELAQLGQTLEHRPEHQFVDALDRFDLEIGAAHVAGFVGSLDMEQQEILVA